MFDWTELIFSYVLFTLNISRTTDWAVVLLKSVTKKAYTSIERLNGYKFLLVPFRYICPIIIICCIFYKLAHSLGGIGSPYLSSPKACLRLIRSGNWAFYRGGEEGGWPHYSTRSKAAVPFLSCLWEVLVPSVSLFWTGFTLKLPRTSVLNFVKPRHSARPSEHFHFSHVLSHVLSIHFPPCPLSFSPV